MTKKTKFISRSKSEQDKIKAIKFFSDNLGYKTVCEIYNDVLDKKFRGVTKRHEGDAADEQIARGVSFTKAHIKELRAIRTAKLNDRHHLVIQCQRIIEQIKKIDKSLQTNEIYIAGAYDDLKEFIGQNVDYGEEIKAGDDTAVVSIPVIPNL